MSKHPIIYLLIGITFLVVPTVVYLIFLVPKLCEEYNILMSSAGIIGSTGMYATSKIPEKWKYSALAKTASNSINALIVMTIVQEFVNEIIGLFAVFIASLIIYKIFVEVWKGAKQRKQNSELAKEIARSVSKTSE